MSDSITTYLAKKLIKYEQLGGFEMDVQEKRKLLEAIDILVRRPMMADETTLGNAIGYFTKLINDVTQGQLSIQVVTKGDRGENQ